MVIYAYFLVNSEDRFVYRASKQKECHISIHNSSQEIIFVILKVTLVKTSVTFCVYTSSSHEISIKSSRHLEKKVPNMDIAVREGEGD